jgi:hypothetical protein
MKLRLCAAATLACVVIGAFSEQPVEAQWGSVLRLNHSQPKASARATGTPAYYQQPTDARSTSQSATPTPAYEQLPEGVPSSDNGQPMPVLGGYGPDSYDGGYCGDGCDSYGCETGCCGNCGGYGSDCSCFCPPGCNLCGGVWSQGRYFITADYLYVRASFSEAIAFLSEDDSQQNLGRDDFRQLDFQYESSYRFGGGYRLASCGDEIRFMFTRLSSNAFEIAPDGTFAPYEASPPPNGQTNISADVDVKSYDVEFAKRIPLGMSPCGNCGNACGCGDPCGCGSCCGGCGCPTWELTWSGGFRFADVDWNRSYVAVESDGDVATDASAVMNFRGGGPRIGLEGRRYFFDGGMLSVYMKGDISLLLGHLDLVSHRIVEGGSAPDLENIQTTHGRHVIPVTELETGLTGLVTNNVTLTTGYLFSAWHDLGFRDQFDFGTFLNTSYDDANILGFDGFFARLEVAF